MTQAHLALVLHSHQPVGNFDHVIEETYSKAYAPFLDLLAEHPRVRIGLHYSGFLLEWIEARHPEFFDRLRELVGRGQIELVGGGFFEPILSVIPDRDKRAQLVRLREYLRSRFGSEPRGAWLAERVWEPSLARPLAEAGVEYIVLDDTHFLAAGLPANELAGYYMTEESGSALRLVPSLKTLRYTIPFREPEETLEYLRDGLDSAAGDEPLFAVGDDSEKFGSWPGTYEHCYTKGWLKRFFGLVEDAGDWLKTTTLSDYLSHHPPLGRVYLPTASYEEMMIWAMPLESGREFRACLAESSHLPNASRYHRFLRGGFWRNFLAKYPEANQMHKLMLDVSARLERARAAVGASEESIPVSTVGLGDSDRATGLAEAERHLLASQCNDAYWHGIFGGLYTPHLRTGVLGHLIAAETALDRIEPRQWLGSRTFDFDCDGHAEILVEYRLLGVVLRPHDGGTISSLRFKTAGVELINSIMRREEAYHDEVRNAVSSGSSVSDPLAGVSVDAPRTENLSVLLRYDRYLRHAFRTIVFPTSKAWEDYHEVALEDDRQIAAGPWQVSSVRGSFLGNLVGFGLTYPGSGASVQDGTEAKGREITAREASQAPSLLASKAFAIKHSGATWSVSCESVVRFGPKLEGHTPRRAVGLEFVFNLLAPTAPGRYFVLSGAKGERVEPLAFAGELESGPLTLIDEWQGFKITLAAEPEPIWWIDPIETVSQSEAGFERVYQGSAVMAVWRPESPPGAQDQLETRLTVTVEPWVAGGSGGTGLSNP